MSLPRVNLIARAVVACLVATLAVWMLATVRHRIKGENANNRVEIAIEFSEAAALCRSNNYSLDDFLERCRAVGVVSAVLNEETLSSLTADGKIVFFPKAMCSGCGILILPPGRNCPAALSLLPAMILPQR